MFHLLLISSLFVSAFSGLVPARHLSAARGGRIIGGDLAKPEDFPYQAEVYTSDVTQRFYLCGGAILSENVIITAASCILRAPADEWYVHVGSNLALEDGQTVSGRKIVYHNLYNDWTQDYDIALLFLYRTLAIDDETIKPIALPTQGQVIPDGTLAATCGWGKRSGGVSSFRLYNVTLAVVNQAQCVAAFNPFNWLVSDRMLCASRSETGNDVDSGDVGGPLVANDVLIGITSWGFNYVRASYPGVWTRVPSFVTWITTNMIET